MTSRSSRLVGAITLVSCLAGRVSIVCAQGIELTPVSGYRFGWNLFETVAGQPIDLDGAPALGFVVDVPLSDGLQVEGLFTHQHARTPPWRRGPLGLTRYAADASNELRFNLAAGGGMKLFATPHLGLRLDGRVFATF